MGIGLDGLNPSYFALGVVPGALRIVNASKAIVMASSAVALNASDQCTPMMPPRTPTVIPENARNPRPDMLYSPMTRPRMAAATMCQNGR